MQCVSISCLFFFKSLEESQCQWYPLVPDSGFLSLSISFSENLSNYGLLEVDLRYIKLPREHLTVGIIMLLNYGALLVRGKFQLS